MKIFGISDLHLSFASNKPMDRFGDVWIRHWEKVEERWKACVRDTDLVLVPGDHSWGMKMAEVLPDLEFIGRLPGTKIMGKGNHDLWWHSTNKLQQLGLANFMWVQGNCVTHHGIAVAGTRGWALPGTEFCATEEDHTIFRREVGRLKTALEAYPPTGYRIAMLHYPPLLTGLMDTEFTSLLEQYGVQQVVYGHLHLGHLSRMFQGEHHGITYSLLSCDVNNFEPVRIWEV